MDRGGAVLQRAVAARSPAAVLQDGRRQSGRHQQDRDRLSVADRSRMGMGRAHQRPAPTPRNAFRGATTFRRRTAPATTPIAPPVIWSVASYSGTTTTRSSARRWLRSRPTRAVCSTSAATSRSGSTTSTRFRRKRDARDPLGPDTGDYHVIRGSSWMNGTITELRLTFRDYGTDGRPDLGFRIARFAE